MCLTGLTGPPSEVSELLQESQCVLLMPRGHVYHVFSLCQIKEASLFFHLHLLTLCTCILTVWCMIVLFMCHSVSASLVMSCS